MSTRIQNILNWLQKVSIKSGQILEKHIKEDFFYKIMEILLPLESNYDK